MNKTPLRAVKRLVGVFLLPAGGNAITFPRLYFCLSAILTYLRTGGTY